MSRPLPHRQPLWSQTSLYPFSAGRRRNVSGSDGTELFLRSESDCVHLKTRFQASDHSECALSCLFPAGCFAEVRERLARPIRCGALLKRKKIAEYKTMLGMEPTITAATKLSGPLSDIARAEPKKSVVNQMPGRSKKNDGTLRDCDAFGRRG